VGVTRRRCGAWCTRKCGTLVGWGGGRALVWRVGVVRLLLGTQGTLAGCWVGVVLVCCAGWLRADQCFCGMLGRLALFLGFCDMSVAVCVRRGSFE
jgi:hypothetical protein